MGTDTKPRPVPTIEEMRCPVCGHEGSFLVEMTERVLLFADGDAVYGDAPARYEDDSDCVCHGCHHTGRVHQFRKP